MTTRRRPSAKSLANLRPQRAGEPGHNRTGKNQWTLQNAALKALEERGRENPEDLVEPVWRAHLRGKPWACRLVWERALPAVQRHDIDLHGLNESALETALDRFLTTGEEAGVPAKPNGNGAA